MTQDKHKETARQIADEWFPTERGKGDLVRRITTALTNLEADAYARGRGEAKAEDAERVKVLKRYDPLRPSRSGSIIDATHGPYLNRDDVLAAITASDSSPQKAVIDPPDVVPPDLTTGLDDIFAAAIRKEEGR